MAKTDTQDEISIAASKALLDSAKRLRTQGRRCLAIGILGSLARDERFPYRDVARQQLAIALFETGQLTEAAEELRALALTASPETTFMGDNLILLAQVTMAMPHTDHREIGVWVGQARRIFDNNREFGRLGRAIELSGVVHAMNGDVLGATERLSRGSRMAVENGSSDSEIPSNAIKQASMAGMPSSS